MARAPAKRQSTELAFADERPDWAGEGRGNEEVTSADLTIPRLDILQSGSKKIDPDEPSYIEGATMGNWFNTATDAVYGKEVMFIPCHFRVEYIVWRDADLGGGFRGAFGTVEEAKSALNALEDAEDCDIVDTAQHFGLLVHEDMGVEEIVLSCASTKHKPSRKLNTMIKMRGGDRFSSIYKLSIIGAENAAGKKYYNFDVKPLGYVSEDLYHRAERLYDAVKDRRADVDRRQHDDTATETVRPDDLDG